jgi:protein phosphatase 4 regulatory subunit 3
MLIEIVDEDDIRSVLFERIITPDTRMTVQQDTVMAWTDEDGKELALSFENIEGCDTFWHQLCKFQKTSSINGQTDIEDELDQELLPNKLELGEKLVQVCDLFKKTTTIGGDTFFPSMGMRKKTKLISEILEKNFVSQLGECFRNAEERNNLDALKKLALITEGFITLSNASILSLLMSDANYMNTFGIFECTLQNN